MCYESRFFRSWPKRKAQKSAQVDSDVQPVRSTVTPIRPAPDQEIQRRREVKREHEEVV
jgi:hypothetical protein